MIERVISGGQTGADQAGWRAARAAGIATGGWMPKGFLTEEGPRPEFDEMFGAREHHSPHYPDRTRANILWSDATLIFVVDGESPGTKATAIAVYTAGRPCVIVKVYLSEEITPHRSRAIVEWIRGKEVKTLNVAGNRESKAPGIGAWVERYLAEVFRLLKGDQTI
jgi:predicted Rossmann-fold nucleotide-binding protein